MLQTVCRLKISTLLVPLWELDILM